MPQFDISNYSSQIFWILFSFGLVVSYSFLFFFPKIYKIFTQRMDFISEGKEKIERITSEIESINKNIQKLNGELDLEISKINIKTEQEMSEYSAKASSELQITIDNILKIKDLEIKEILEKEEGILNERIAIIADKIYIAISGSNDSHLPSKNPDLKKEIKNFNNN